MGYTFFIGDNNLKSIQCDFYSKSFCGAQDLLLTYVPDILYLNYNINTDGNGYDVLEFIEKQNSNSPRFLLPKKIVIVQASAEERARMQLKINSIYRWDNKLEAR